MEQTLRLAPKFEMKSSSFQTGASLEKFPLETRANGCPSEIGSERVIRVVVILFASFFLSCFVIDVLYKYLFVIRVVAILFAIVFFRAFPLTANDSETKP